MSGFDGFAAPEGSRFVRALGRGGLVEAALVERGDELLVAKRLHRSHADASLAHAALVREAQALAALEHPRVPRLLSVGADAHGPYLVETYLPGLTFGSVSDAWSELPRVLGLHLATRAARLLADLHGAESTDGRPLELVHGDLSPSNLLVSPEVDVTIVDFGSSSSRIHEGAAGARGTLPFVAPELARGDVPSTQATDRYALSVLLAELLVGRPLCVRRDAPAMLLSIGERGHDLEPLRAASLDRRVRDALEAELAFEPEGRPRDREALVEALERACRAPS